MSEEKAPATLRGAAIISARVVAGSIAIAVAAATVAAATLLPLPVLTSTPGGTLVEPVASARELVCPGAALRLADDSGQGATTVSPLGLPTVSSGAGSIPFTTSEAGTGGTAAAPQLLSAEQPDGAPQPVSGAQSQLIASGDFIGLAAAACTGAVSESWLVGGSSAVGRTTLLTLSNPTEVTATVSLRLFGESGEVTAPGLAGIAVEPMSQRVLPLAAFAPGLAAPVVRVESRGGHVVATLQQSIVRGITPGGMDVFGASAPPAITTVIPGVVVSGSVAVQQRLGRTDHGDLETALRVFVPGENASIVRVRIAAETGAVGALRSFELEVPAGQVTDLRVDELEDGNYTFIIDSVEPVVASVRVSTATEQTADLPDGTTDFSWMPSANPLATETLFTVAGGMAPVLHLMNPGDVPAELVLTASSGNNLFVTVPAGASVVLGVESGATYLVTGFELLHASVTGTAAGGIAGYAIPPAEVAAGAVLIYP